MTSCAWLYILHLYNCVHTFCSIKLCNCLHACQTFMCVVCILYAGRSLPVISSACIVNSALGAFNTCHWGNNWKKNESKANKQIESFFSYLLTTSAKGIKLTCVPASHLLYFTSCYNDVSWQQVECVFPTGSIIIHKRNILLSTNPIKWLKKTLRVDLPIYNKRPNFICFD